MRYKIITLPAVAADEDELNRFLAAHRIIHVASHFCPGDNGGFWSFCIQYQEGPSPQGGGKKARIDYKEVLTQEEFQKYARLRELRSTLAREEGKPVYALFSNEQLADMVRDRVVTREGMGKIPGVGEGRLARYGPAFLELLNELHNGSGT